MYNNINLIRSIQGHFLPSKDDNFVFHQIQTDEETESSTWKKLFLDKDTIASLNDALEAVKGGASGTGWGCQGPSYCEMEQATGMYATFTTLPGYRKPLSGYLQIFVLRFHLSVSKNACCL